MELEPITRQEKIIAGQDLEPITRMEMFLKNFGGGSGGSGGGGGDAVTTLHINVTAVNSETMEATFTADKTPTEMEQAAVAGPVWCVITFAAGIMAEEAVSFGLPPAWYGVLTFGLAIARVHEDGGNNKIIYAVRKKLPDTWILDLSAFGS